MLYNINLALNIGVDWTLKYSSPLGPYMIWWLDFGIMPRPHFGGSKVLLSHSGSIDPPASRVLLSHSGSIDPPASRGRNLPVVITNPL